MKFYGLKTTLIVSVVDLNNQKGILGKSLSLA